MLQLQLIKTRGCIAAARGRSTDCTREVMCKGLQKRWFSHQYFSEADYLPIKEQGSKERTRKANTIRKRDGKGGATLQGKYVKGKLFKDDVASWRLLTEEFLEERLKEKALERQGCVAEVPQRPRKAFKIFCDEKRNLRTKGDEKDGKGVDDRLWGETDVGKLGLLLSHKWSLLCRGEQEVYEEQAREEQRDLGPAYDKWEAERKGAAMGKKIDSSLSVMVGKENEEMAALCESERHLLSEEDEKAFSHYVQWLKESHPELNGYVICDAYLVEFLKVFVHRSIEPMLKENSHYGVSVENIVEDLVYRLGRAFSHRFKRPTLLVSTVMKGDSLPKETTLTNTNNIQKAKKTKKAQNSARSKANANGSIVENLNLKSASDVLLEFKKWGPDKQTSADSIADFIHATVNCEGKGGLNQAVPIWTSIMDVSSGLSALDIQERIHGKGNPHKLIDNFLLHATTVDGTMGSNVSMTGDYFNWLRTRKINETIMSARLVREYCKHVRNSHEDENVFTFVCEELQHAARQMYRVNSEDETKAKCWDAIFLPIVLSELKAIDLTRVRFAISLAKGVSPDKSCVLNEWRNSKFGKNSEHGMIRSKDVLNISKFLKRTKKMSRAECLDFLDGVLEEAAFSSLPPRTLGEQDKQTHIFEVLLQNSLRKVFG
eukprot:Nk52_evm88s151 gene=Nk52_evmTU88s151